MTFAPSLNKGRLISAYKEIRTCKSSCVHCSEDKNLLLRHPFVPTSWIPISEIF